MLRELLAHLPRSQKLLLAMIIDAMLIALSVWGAFALRLADLWPEMLASRWWLLLAMPAVTLPVFHLVRLYRGVIRHLGTQFTLALLYGVTISALFMPLLVLLTQQATEFSRAASVMYWFLAIVGVGGIRVLARGWFRIGSRDGARPVVIYGAGDAGAQLQSALVDAGQFRVVGFVDDDPGRWKMMINGTSVHDPADIRRLVLRHRCRDIFLAIPSSSRNERREIIERLQMLPVKVRTVPSLEEIVEGEAVVDAIRPIAIEDLLGRDPVDPRQDLLDRCIRGKVVLVTGAGGSIGSELCRQIVRLAPEKLILLERSEFALYSIHQELLAGLDHSAHSPEVLPILGSAGDRSHVSTVMADFDIDTVYHAAAYKHVPLVEYNVASGIMNNAIATHVVAQAAIDHGVSSFVLVSTDKAVRPTNVMGASKRLAELVLQALHSHGSSTRFCMVRFGNVLDSSGSVVPRFKEQIESGGPITVTHPEVIRYFMTIPEAAGLVIQAGSMGTGGDVFLLDMGDAVRIADLARLMIRLAGLTERTDARRRGDIEIRYTGLRPGEKLYEELLIGDAPMSTEHPMIMRANESELPWTELEARLAELEEACRGSNVGRIRELLEQTVEGFSPDQDIADLAWLARTADPSAVT